MALENITVNGKPLKQFIEKEKSDEIQEFLRFELRSMSRMSHRHISTARPNRDVSRAKYQEGGRVEVR